jgi:type VI secretion system protein ImpH
VAGEERPAADPVDDIAAKIAAQARRYNFFGAVALLERLSPGAPRVGGLGPVIEEAIRFRHDPTMTFSPSDVSAIDVVEKPVDPTNDLSPNRVVYEIMTTFLGLTGAATPLPLYFAEEVASEDPDQPSQRQFLDIFHHRILSLFYRMRARYAFTSEFLTDGTDAWSRRVLAIAGVDAYEGQRNSLLPTWRLLRLAPLLTTRARTARNLQLALQDIFGDTLDGGGVDVEQFVGRWVDIEERQRMRLGVVNTVLGKDTTLGVKIFDRGGKIRVVLGPLNEKTFRRFTPDGDQLPLVREVVGLFCRDELECDVEIVLGGDAAPRFKISSKDGSRLGSDTWLGQRREETRMVVDLPWTADGAANGQSGDGTALPESAPQDGAAVANEYAASNFEAREGQYAR